MVDEFFPYKKRLRVVLACLYSLDLFVLLWVIASVVPYPHILGKILETLGLLLGLTGMLQLLVSQFFDDLLERYTREHDPELLMPSSLVRIVIDDPDRPFRTRIRNFLFFDPRGGLWILVSSSLVGILAVWI